MSDQLVGQTLEQSKEIKQNINQIVDQVLEINSSIKGPQKPNEKFVEAAKAHVDKVGVNRGRPLFYPYIGTGSGQGPYVELEDGSVKIDLINGIGIHVLGHSHPTIIKASLQAAISDIVMQGNLQPNKEYSILGEKLIQLASKKSRLKHVWLTTSGSMSGENALKACRQYKSPAKMTIAMKNAFAGRSMMMAEITDNENYTVGLPKYNEVLRVPFYDKNDPKSTEKSFEIFKSHVAKHEGDISNFCFEPMQGEGGYNSAPREFFLPMLDFCKEKGIPVWADEVQTFCRTGEFFAFERLEIGEYVDVCTVAKTLQAGATLFTEELNPKPGLVSGTFAGSTVALAAGIAALTELEDGYMGEKGKIQNIHSMFVGMLNELNEGSCRGLLQDAGGLGLMVAATPLDGSKEKMLALLKTLYKNGLMTFGCGRGPFRLRFLLPATLTEENISVCKKIIEKSVLELA